MKEEKRVEGGGEGEEREGEKLRNRPTETPVFLGGILNCPLVWLRGIGIVLTGKYETKVRSSLDRASGTPDEDEETKPRLEIS